MEVDLSTDEPSALAQSKIVEADRGEVRVPGGLDDLARSGVAIHHDGDRSDFRSDLLEGRDRGERRAAGGRGVFQHDHSLTVEVWPLDLAATAVILRFLANHEGVVGQPANGTLVHHCRGDRIGAHRHPPDSADVLNPGDEVEHHLPDEGGDPVVETHLAQVDIVGRLRSAGENEVSVEHGIRRDEVDELLPRVRHGPDLTCRATSVVGMRVATWNVNSIRTRVGRVVDWLGRADIDVLAMQEIKCKEGQFPFEPFHEAGYEIALHGLNQWNGVAFASRIPLEHVTIGFPSAPGFSKTEVAGDPPLEARAMGVTVDGIRLWSLYVPNGRALDDPHYSYKLDWLAKLATDTADWMKQHPNDPIALMGDWNVAPLDSDVWPTWPFATATHTSTPERAAFARFETIGLTDVVRPLVADGYTFWDYQQLRFPRNEGMRIDFIMGSPAFADLVSGARIERNERKGDGPSDHVPVVVDLAVDGGDDDDRPMIF